MNGIPSSDWGKMLRTAWSGTLAAVFAVMCIRFVWTDISSAEEAGPAALLGTGCLFLGFFLPSESLFAFALAIPLLNGLDKTFLFSVASPLGLAFSGIWLGRLPATLRRGILENPTTTFRRADRANGGWALVASMILGTLIVFSLALQISRHWHEPGLWHDLGHSPVEGFGSPYYFITSSFLWMQGIFFFGALFSQREHLTLWLRPFIAVYTATMTAFLAFQVATHVPEADMIGHDYFLPFDDISSFGSIVVALLILALGMFGSLRAPLPVRLIGIAALTGMLVASRSRAAWLSGAAFVTLIVAARANRRWTLAIVVFLVSATLWVNVTAVKREWPPHSYMARLVDLARLENPANKSPERINLYYKGLGMVRDRPLVGHGIGSFYLSSAHYARAGDNRADAHDFAHDAWLQVAAELGAPAALLLAGLNTAALLAGLVGFRRIALKSKRSINGPLRNDLESRASAATAFGAALALAAYLETQLTANSLNVYLSNQFFFWFLSAVLLFGLPSAAGDESDVSQAPYFAGG